MVPPWKRRKKSETEWLYIHIFVPGRGESGNGNALETTGWSKRANKCLTNMCIKLLRGEVDVEVKWSYWAAVV